MPMSRHMYMTEAHSSGTTRSRWSVALISFGVGLTVAIAAFVAAVEVTLRARDARPAPVAGLVIALGLLFMPGRWRWLALAWCIGLAAFGAFYLALASAPNYGDLGPGR